MTKIVATGTYINGAFGRNHVSIVRKAGGYVVRMHAHDGFFIKCAKEAKREFRRLVTTNGVSDVTFRKWAAQ